MRVKAVETLLLEKGLVEGTLSEARTSFSRVLTLRFGEPSEAVRTKIASADLESLRRWLEAAVFAETVDDVF